MAGAWLSWTGGSLVLCLFAVMTVLIEPAAASSGIPGLIAYLNGVEPKGGKSPLTGKYFKRRESVHRVYGKHCS